MTKEEPKCTASTCPEMRASEWQYLCAVHEPPKPCCAIDYCNHTLDWASDTLTASKNFPSRLTLGSAASGGSQQGVRHLTNIMRRVYRIFAHAWFQHREGVFWPIEGQGGLYTLFKTVCDVYSLIPEENYTIPPEAEGLSSDSAEDGEEKTVLKKDDEEEGDEDATTTLPAAATTRRHKHTPSVGSVVPTIAEGDEDDHERESPLAQISKSAESVEKKPASPDKRAATEEVADVEKGGEGLGGKAHEEKGPGGKAHEEEEPRGKAHEEEGPRGKAHEEEGPGPEVFETET